MALQCNIDSRGKAVRLVMGGVTLLVGIALTYFWARGSGEAWRWIAAAAAMLAGAFMLFEARAGWCVVRAMGIKTRV